MMIFKTKELILARWNSILKPLYKFDSDFSHVITLELVLNEGTIHFQLHHLQGSAKGATQDLTVRTGN